MSLREMLDLCQDTHSDEWVLIPGGRPATAMLAGVFDPGMKDHALTRPLAGHSIAVYEPDPALSMVWPVPEEPEAEELEPFNRPLPEWAEQDGHDWKHPRLNYAVVLLSGAPVWAGAGLVSRLGRGHRRIRPVHRGGARRRLRGRRAPCHRVERLGVGGGSSPPHQLLLCAARVVHA